MREITIIGGGIAGLALGIFLRRHGIPVTLYEAHDYPRHRVCGEFITGAGRTILEELNLWTEIQTAGARTAETVGFFSEHTSIGQETLPERAIGISRYFLDAALARMYVRTGGILRVKQRLQPSDQPGLVRATGRQIVSGKNKWRYFGLKIHAIGAALTADLELHFSDSGYVGLSRVEKDAVNLCGLFRSRAPVPDLSERWAWYLCGKPGSILRRKLETAVFDRSSFCAVAGLPAVPQSAPDGTCQIGDTMAMIPPFTGNGISMALESACYAASPLFAYSRQQQDWPETVREIRRIFNRQFTSRLWWSKWLHRGLFSPAIRSWLERSWSTYRRAWPLLYWKTR